jgi:arylsulfatase A-like enzyme
MYRAFCIVYYLDQQMHEILTTMYRKKLYDKDIVVNILCICWYK